MPRRQRAASKRFFRLEIHRDIKKANLEMPTSGFLSATRDYMGRSRDSLEHVFIGLPGTPRRDRDLIKPGNSHPENSPLDILQERRYSGDLL